MKKIIFWAVDCQKDFVNKEGALYVEGAESIKPNLKKLTDLASKYDITVVNTMDCHDVGDVELSENPDFVFTFPPHCMIASEGSELIEETDITKTHPLATNTHIILKKNKFNVFIGNSNVEKVLEALNPKLIIVYGVATNVCVNYAVLGLTKRGYKVIVIKDAIKELPNLSVKEIYNNWKELGVIFETTKNIESIINDFLESWKK